MKSPLFAVVASGLAMFTVAACAAEAQQSLTPVVAEARRSVDCTPPNDSSDCKALHAQIRSNFTPEEISMLFGAATPSLQYPTGYAKVKERYAAFVAKYENANSVAVVVVGDPIKP